MTAGATLILRHVVVATELAQQEEAHGDSTEKVKLSRPVDGGAENRVAQALDWHTPYYSPQDGHAQAHGSKAHDRYAQEGDDAQEGNNAQEVDRQALDRHAQEVDCEAGHRAQGHPQDGQAHDRHAQEGNNAQEVDCQAHDRAQGHSQDGQALDRHAQEVDREAGDRRAQDSAEDGSEEHGQALDRYTPQGRQAVYRHAAQSRLRPYRRTAQSDSFRVLTGAHRDEPHGNVGRNRGRSDHPGR